MTLPRSYQNFSSDQQALPRGTVMDVYFVMRITYDQVSPLATVNCFFVLLAPQFIRSANLQSPIRRHGLRELCSYENYLQYPAGNADDAKCCKLSV